MPTLRFHTRINRHLTEFTRALNRHPLSTAGGKSPFQLWTLGMNLKLYETAAAEITEGTSTDSDSSSV